MQQDRPTARPLSQVSRLDPMFRIRELLDRYLPALSLRGVRPGSCSTRYPILLLHGLAFRDDMVVSSWGRVPAYLRRGGAQVHLGELQAWASYEDTLPGPAVA